METRASKHKLEIKVGIYKLWSRAGKHKLRARAGKYKLGARAGGESKGLGPRNTKTLYLERLEQKLLVSLHVYR